MSDREDMMAQMGATFDHPCAACVAKDAEIARLTEEMNTIIRQKWTVEGERDAVVKNEREYLTARARGFRACDADEPLENCARERYQHEQEGWASGWMERATQRERDDLKSERAMLDAELAALRAERDTLQERLARKIEERLR